MIGSGRSFGIEKSIFCDTMPARYGPDGVTF
jgi:hypothetical protein